MSNFDFSVNFWALLLGAIVHVIIGSLWYSPLLFGRYWLSAMKVTDEEIAAAREKGMAMNYILTFIGSVVQVVVLAFLMNAFLITNFWSGVLLGVITAFGFSATALLNSVLWEGKPWKLYFLNIGYHIVTLGLVGGILAIWR